MAFRFAPHYRLQARVQASQLHDCKPLDMQYTLILRSQKALLLLYLEFFPIYDFNLFQIIFWAPHIHDDSSKTYTSQLSVLSPIHTHSIQ